MPTRPWIAVVALSASLFMIMLDNTIVSVALPSIAADLGARLSQLQWIVNAYVLSFAALLLLGGKLADQLGRRAVFLAGVALFVIASAACGLAPGPSALIAARAIQGVGAALMLPASLSIISALFPPERRGTAIGLWAGISLSALTIGPLAGGALTAYASWHWVFMVNVPIGALGLAGGVLFVPDSRDDSARGGFDLAGMATSAVALFALTFALIEGSAAGWSSPAILAALALAAAGLPAFVAIERRATRPMIDLGLFRDPTFTGANLVALISVLAMFGILFLFPIYLASVLHLSALRVGTTFLPMTVVLAAVTPFAGRWSDRRGPRGPMTAGMTAVALALACASRFGEHTGTPAVTAPLILAGIGFALTMTPMTAAVLGAAPVDKAGVAAGVVNAFRQIGAALGVGVMGALVQGPLHGLAPGAPGYGAAFVSGFDRALLLGAACAAVAALLAWRLIAAPTPDRALVAEPA
jgi:EmrB/QacA subfamily drug resistance transporter